MKDILNPYIESQISRLKQADALHLLSDPAISQLYDHLLLSASRIFQSTYLNLLSEEGARINPLASYDPALLTIEQKEITVRNVKQKLSDGSLTLPEPVDLLLREVLTHRTDAFLEMMDRLSAHREEICRTLLQGRLYTTITHISTGAGDSHRQGRSVCILTTDAGKMVYKPRDMRGDMCIYELVQRYFPEMIGIPKCFACSDQFGITAFIEKKRPHGPEEAALFYRNFGGLTAFLKALGSTDMHVENITCAGTLPTILDLETILSPVSGTDAHNRPDPVLYRAQRDSVFYTTLLPKSGPNDHEFSPLMNCSDAGCAPEIDGEYVNVLPYLESFEAGFHLAYQRILENRDAICRALEQAARGLPIRVLLANTQNYADVQRKLYDYHSLSSAEKAKQTRAETLEKMQKIASKEFKPLIAVIFSQMIHGDIPYFYTRAEGVDLMSDGNVVSPGFFGISPLEHALHILENMNAADEAFDRALLRRSLAQYPCKKKASEVRTPSVPKLREEILSREEALREAQDLFRLVDSLAIPVSGSRLWGQINSQGSSFQFCDLWMGTGLSGIAVFSAAVAAVSEEKNTKRKAMEITAELLADIQTMLDWMLAQDPALLRSLSYGEANGVGGLLGAFALIRRMLPMDEIPRMQEKLLRMIRLMDLSLCHIPDRICGLAELLSVLCRFEEYQTETELIQKTADCLLAMKQLHWHKEVLWQSFPDKKRPISGAGHGLTGIAEALFAAAHLLQEPKYRMAAMDALRFEASIFNSQMGTWPDLRDYPPVNYMHGYCSGAPGIGIMLAKIEPSCGTDPLISHLRELCSGAMQTIPLRERDHLCCGNSALAEYYVATGNYEEAGRLLAAMKTRKERAGCYTYMDSSYRNSVTASLFYGASGIGYEMLRYACPEKIPSLF